MSKQLPARPSLEQYRKQAKELLKAHRIADPSALERIRQHHPTLHKLSLVEIATAPFALTDAQLILAREHNFESWPEFAHHIETLSLIRNLAELKDPIAAFIEVACVPRHSGHGTGTLEHAELILSRYPHVATANIHTAAILAESSTVKKLLKENPKDATVKGGPHQWDALTHLCFSRYLRLDKSRSEAFVRTAKLLLDAGASGNSGWYETIDQPQAPRLEFESVIYGAAAVAQHSGLAKLLLERGADPNDGETPYHVVETYDNTVLKILLESGKLNRTSLNTILLRKADWHDEDGMQLALEHGADPNTVTRWGFTALHQALRRDNGLIIIELLLNHGADPSLIDREGSSAVLIAARRGRADVLNLLVQRGIPITLGPLDQLIAACAQNNTALVHSLTSSDSALIPQLIAEGGTLLAEFAGNGNTEGIRQLLDVGISPSALYKGDGYYEIAKGSTALHVAAWRAHPAAVKLFIARGAPISALDGEGHTALQLAIRAATDSYWKYRRTTESIEALLKAGATTQNIQLPTGYPEADELLTKHASAVRPPRISPMKGEDVPSNEKTHPAPRVCGLRCRVRLIY